jgi:hypothetical protein
VTKESRAEKPVLSSISEAAPAWIPPSWAHWPEWLHKDGGVLQIADSGARNRRSLEDLGLDFLMEIDPPDAPWRGDLDAVRSKLNTPAPAGAPGQVQRAQHVLEAHQTLSETNEKNAREFSSVVTLLENELAEKEKREAKRTEKS